MSKPTQREWELADSYLPDSWTPCQTEDEVSCVMDAIANGEDPTDALHEYRHWHSPAGRRQEAYELFETGHPMGDLVSLD